MLYYRFYITALLLFLDTAFLQGQNDFAIQKSIDSLIIINRTAIEKNNFEKAFESIAEAEKNYFDHGLDDQRYYGTIIFNKGRTYDFNGDILKAKEFYFQSLSIRKKSLDHDDIDVAESLNNLGYIYFVLGSYEKAEKAYSEATSIRKKRLGKEDPIYAGSLNNLASLYRRMGAYEKAELLYLESLEIRLNTFGEEHPEYAASLNNLANLYLNMNIFAKAELYFLKAKTLLEKSYGKEHLDYAQNINNLGILYMKNGDYALAEKMLKESIEIRKTNLGKQHPLYAQNLNNLANLYVETENYTEAVNLFNEANEVRKAILGAKHPSYAQSLNNLGLAYHHMGDYREAEKLFTEAKNIRAEILGKEHPDYSQNITNLANLYLKKGEIENAKLMYLEANTLEKELIINGSRHLSERELSIYINDFNNKQNKLLSIAEDHSELAERVYNNSLFYKGFVLNIKQKMNRLARSDSATMEMYLDLKAINRRLAQEFSKPKESRKNSDALIEEANRIEKKLTNSVWAFGQAFRQIKWEEVQQKLSSESVALEFVHYQKSLETNEDNTHYAVIALKHNTAPKFVKLFTESALDSILEVSTDRRSDYVNDLYSINDRGVIISETKKRSLYEVIWKPLQNELRGVKTIYYSPTGLLHRINLSAIPIDADQCLADQFIFNQLSSTRNLVVNESNIEGDKIANLYGGIEFDKDTTYLDTSNSKNESNDLVSDRSNQNNKTDEIEAKNFWNYLPWTKKEVEDISVILNDNEFKTDLLMGNFATERKFNAIGQSKISPQILHIATHGFFFPDPKLQSITGSKKSVFVKSDDPMIRSGLLMAGANYAWSGKSTNAQDEDGILTAYEISQMNLSNTELVVLSACETGLGDIAGNEGVYGLQRAFKIAGVKYLMMSLWQVPDRQTKDFMISFYKFWLSDKLPIRAAFKKAQNESRDRFYDPYFWAGFVLLE